MKAIKLANEFRTTMIREVMTSWGSDAAIELRRLAEVNAALVKALELLENAFIVHTNWNGEPIAEVQQARAARAKAKE